MIRHVIMVQFKPTATEEQIAFLTDNWEDFRTRYRGLAALTFGRDLELRAGNMSAAAVFDFEDEASFIAFDRDDHHNQVRARLPEFVEKAERCQFQI